MSFEYTLEEMLMVRASAEALGEAGIAEDFWGGRYVGFPHNHPASIALVRACVPGAGNCHTHDEVEHAMDADPRVTEHRRVWAVLISKLERLSHEEREAMHMTSVHGWWDCNRFHGYVYGTEQDAKAALREAGALGTVLNAQGEEVDFEAALAAMDTELVRDLHRKMDPSPKQEFFDTYCEYHRLKFGEEFIFNRTKASVVE